MLTWGNNVGSETCPSLRRIVPSKPWSPCGSRLAKRPLPVKLSLRCLESSDSALYHSIAQIGHRFLLSWKVTLRASTGAGHYREIFRLGDPTSEETLHSSLCVCSVEQLVAWWRRYPAAERKRKRKCWSFTNFFFPVMWTVAWWPPAPAP